MFVDTKWIQIPEDGAFLSLYYVLEKALFNIALQVVKMAYFLVFLLTVAFSFLDSAGQNKQHSSSKDTAKLDRETEELHRMFKCFEEN